MKTEIKPTKKIARKVLETVDAGLSEGLGEPEAGKMCIEAAVCFAFGLPHGDHPPCVGSAVREFKIRLNDSSWSSNEARAKGMRKLAIAQLGSDTIDQMAFGKRMFLLGTQRLMPFVMRKCAADSEVKEEHRVRCLEIADKCEKVTNHNEAMAEVRNASAYAYAYASAYAYAYASASASAYAYASASAYAYAYASAYAYAYAYASAYAYAYAYAWFKTNLGDELLTLTADIGLEVLKELNSPGCAWLDLCE